MEQKHVSTDPIVNTIHGTNGTLLSHNSVQSNYSNGMDKVTRIVAPVGSK